MPPSGAPVARAGVPVVGLTRVAAPQVRSPWPRPFGSAQATSASTAVGARHGRVRWRVPLRQGAEWRAMVEPEHPHLAVGTQGDVYSLAGDRLTAWTRQGRRRYDKPTTSGTGPVVLPNGDLVVYQGSYHAHEVVRYRADGRLVWRHSDPTNGSETTPLLLPGGEDLLTLCLDGGEIFDVAHPSQAQRHLHWAGGLIKFKAPPVLHPDGTVLLLTVYTELARVGLTGDLLGWVNLSPALTPGNNREAAAPPACGPDASIYVVDTSGYIDSRIPLVRLRAVDPHWKVRWTWRGPAHCQRSPPAVSHAGDIVYYPDPQGRLCALRARDGTVLWRVAGPGRRTSSLTAPSLDARGVAYSVDRTNNTLLAISPTGKLAWQVRLRGRSPIRPIIGPSQSVLISTDRYLYCVE